MALGGWLLVTRVAAAQHVGRPFGLGDARAGLLLGPLAVGAITQALVRGPLGWLIAAAGVLGIFAGTVADLPALLRPAVAPWAVAMLLLLGAGVGGLARSASPPRGAGGDQA